ncbi:MAG: MerR family transcriptional regulator [Bacteroidia bacterium]
METGSSKKYFKIGEVSEMLGVPASTLRFWEKNFPQIQPMKNKKGDRIYHLKDIDLLRNIHYLVKEKGMHLAKASKQMRRSADLSDPKLELVKQLRAFKEQLLDLKKQLE